MNRKNRFRRKLSFHLLSRFLLSYFIYVIIILIGLFTGIFVSSQVTWYSGNLMYALLRMIADHIYFILAFLFIGGFIILFTYFWLKTLKYLERVIEATSSLYKNKEEFIVLPDELKDVENQINQIRMDMMQNERIAKEAERRKNDLVVYLAHDLKTPLTSVIGYLSLLRDEGQISEELREKYLSISLDKAERLEDLINEFFEITRFNLTNLSLDISKINLTRMLEQILYEFKPMLNEKELSIKLIAQQDIYVVWDVNKMQRVFDNLIRNAVNYSFEQSTIEVTLLNENNRIKIQFLNNGYTIPEEKLNRIFEQFYRLDSARTSKTGGAGLGLAIAKEIVTLHKGEIYAASKDNKIIFDVIIPANVGNS